MKKEIIDKLLNEEKLHDAKIIGVTIKGNSCTLQISTEDMDIERYFKNINNVIFKLQFKELYKLILDYQGGDIINNFILTNNDKITLKIDNDILIEAETIDIDTEIILKQTENNRRLDKFLKSNL